MDLRVTTPNIDTNSPYYVNEGECPIAKLPAEVACKIFALAEGSESIPLVSTRWNAISREKCISSSCLERMLPCLSSLLVKADVPGAYDEIVSRIRGIWEQKKLPHLLQDVQPTFVTVELYAKRYEEYKNLMELALAVSRHLRQGTALKDKLKIESDPVLRLPHIKKWFEENQAELAGLSNLSIQIGEITEIPEELNYFTGLEKISFRGSQIRSIPGHFGRDLPLLNSVDLRQNQVSTISPEFCLSHNNIQTLYLDQNKIGELPENFGLGMTKLSTLDLGSNKLKKVPSSFGTLFPDMYRLSLTDNEVEELDDDFGSNWTKLKFCELKGNKMNKLPSTLAVNSARVMLFNADWEKMEECPEHLMKFSAFHKAQKQTSRTL